MKRIAKCSGILLFVFASATGIGATFDIDRQIEKIRSVKDPARRVRLMNRLKRQLIRLNNEQREAAIKKLRARQKKQHIQNLQQRQNTLQEQAVPPLQIPHEASQPPPSQEPPPISQEPLPQTQEPMPPSVRPDDDIYPHIEPEERNERRDDFTKERD